MLKRVREVIGSVRLLEAKEESLRDSKMDIRVSIRVKIKILQRVENVNRE